MGVSQGLRIADVVPIDVDDTLAPTPRSGLGIVAACLSCCSTPMAPSAS